MIYNYNVNVLHLRQYLTGCVGQFAQCYSSLDVLNKVYFKCYVVTSIKRASSNNSYRLEVKGQGISWKFFSNLWSLYMAKCTQYNSLFVTCDRSVVFSGTPVFSINKTDCHDITEILLKVALNTINHQPSKLPFAGHFIKIGPDLRKRWTNCNLGPHFT